MGIDLVEIPQHGFLTSWTKMRNRRNRLRRFLRVSTASFDDLPAGASKSGKRRSGVSAPS